MINNRVCCCCLLGELKITTTSSSARHEQHEQRGGGGRCRVALRLPSRGPHVERTQHAGRVEGGTNTNEADSCSLVVLRWMRRERQLSGSCGPSGGPAWSLWVEMWPPKNTSGVQHVQVSERRGGSERLLETRNDEGHVGLSAGIKGGVDRSVRSLEV